MMSYLAHLDTVRKSDLFQFIRS